MNDPTLYTTEDDRSQIKLRGTGANRLGDAVGEGELLDVTEQNVPLCLQDIFKGELAEDWALYDNAGDEPVLLGWSEKP